MVETGARGERGQGLDVADVEPVDEVGAEQGLDHRIAAALGCGKPDQPMGAQGVRRPPDALKSEFDPLAAPGSGDRGIAAHGLARVAELRRQVELPRNSLGGHVRI